MAYGQTGTGKTFTLGRLGDEDTADRGIMVRSMEDILADISPETDSVSVSYLQVGFPLNLISCFTLFILNTFPSEICITRGIIIVNTTAVHGDNSGFTCS